MSEKKVATVSSLGSLTQFGSISALDMDADGATVSIQY